MGPLHHTPQVHSAPTSRTKNFQGRPGLLPVSPTTPPCTPDHASCSVLLPPPLRPGGLLPCRPDVLEGFFIRPCRPQVARCAAEKQVHGGWGSRPGLGRGPRQLCWPRRPGVSPRRPSPAGADRAGRKQEWAGGASWGNRASWLPVGVAPELLFLPTPTPPEAPGITNIPGCQLWEVFPGPASSF